MHNGDDVARGCSIIAYDSADVAILPILSAIAVAAAGVKYAPTKYTSEDYAHPSQTPIELEAGDYVRFHWDAGGASTGGTSVIMLTVREVEI